MKRNPITAYVPGFIWHEHISELFSFLRRSRLIPVIIVSAFAGIIAHSSYIATATAISSKFSETPDWMDALMVIQWISSFTTQILLWIICAAFTHLMAVIFDGRGMYRDLLFLWGYGYIPMVFAALYFYFLLISSTELFVDAALSLKAPSDIISGLSTAKGLSILAQCMTGFWAAWCVTFIYRIPLWKSALCLILPILSIMIMRTIFN